ncbi:phosphatase PAP2 family protein [Adlercreutzia sp. R21]|uniref:phosphatase PAP2 family protein n=1 Tax=Adlercreutzia wanghongyangiae TaxID=3111451 RepID=UPI002DBD725E|nr:phosphatase PAP2 family protein [Adlercreutzia sp. R21]MEC4184467.1 phosphatase PAP2 family protein [Adlercreutzia sp. R21]
MRDGAGYAACYERKTRALRSRPWAVELLRGANKVLTLLFYLAYAALFGCLLLRGEAPPRLVWLVVVPGVAFVVVSWYRRRFDAPRPYECCPIEPLISRDGAGRSFPSRHAFSAFAIACCWFAASALVAAALLIGAALLALCRVAGGVHFPRDVIVGGAIGVAAGGLAAALFLLL